MDESVERMLRLFRKTCLDVAGGSLEGHCGAVSLAVQSMFGGCIVRGKVDGAQHFWNLLPCGIEVDLTSCQFGGDGWKPLVKGRIVKRPKLIDPLFLMFAIDVQRRLAG